MEITCRKTEIVDALMHHQSESSKQKIEAEATIILELLYIPLVTKPFPKKQSFAVGQSTMIQAYYGIALSLLLFFRLTDKVIYFVLESIKQVSQA